MRRSSSYCHLWWALLALSAVVVLSSCRTSSAGQQAIPILATGTSTGTATATSTTAVLYATPLATALPTMGWTIYHDPHYPFQLPIPKGWQLHAYSWPQQGAGSCAYYGVGLFPPEVTPVLTPPLSETNRELIEVSISLTCAPAVFDSVGGWFTETTPVSVSGIRTNAYDRDDVLSRRCAAGSLFGGRQYIFYEQSPPSTAARDISVFHALLAGFQYTGK